MTDSLDSLIRLHASITVGDRLSLELLLSKRDSVLEFLQLTAEKKKRKNKERVINLNLIC
jgi:hypothetical protein